MAIYLRPLSGPAKDKSFQIRAGFSIGRTEGDIILSADSKLSSRHAFIEKLENGDFYLVDNGSKNGIRRAGELVQRVHLVPGVKLTIGSYNYEVTELVEEATLVKPKSKYWHELLFDFVKPHIAGIENHPRGVVALHPAIVLDFVRGLQIDTRWVLGFGPRRIGAGSIDLPIFEPGVPQVCFEILPTPGGISFKTNYPQIVKLNGKAVTAEILRIADVIKINDTEIEVDFIE
jgi:hypothetical protein